jgi:hypothetical protein
MYQDALSTKHKNKVIQLYSTIFLFMQFCVRERPSFKVVLIIICIKLQSLKILKHMRNKSSIHLPLTLITQRRITTKIKVLLSPNNS